MIIYIDDRPFQTDAARLTSRQIRELDNPIFQRYYQVYYREHHEPDWKLKPLDDADPPLLKLDMRFYLIPAATY